MATYKELLAQKADLDARIEEARAAEVGAAIEKIRALMEQFGLTPDDVVQKRRGRPAGKVKAERQPLAPKYQDPKTGQTWSGRGRAPAWIGRNRDRFLIAAE
ncbi:H-NS histone family protein (plasmid) [Cupriavidus pinatubonensis]|uniref:H-NS histone family protein n=1 Tax=Cupriavidus pinatubonensis TaxID=248026 RepID=UPI001C72C69F|nr:H-NS histone family protein [Cupriavidus pinatubonensis]QYY33580.1 H-NS histone family protein [Cupriavidus pinatubonensis]